MNTFVDVCVLSRQWMRFDALIREFIIAFVDFVDQRWYVLLSDQATVLMHVFPGFHGTSSSDYHWRYGWLLDTKSIVFMHNMFIADLSPFVDDLDMPDHDGDGMYIGE